MSVRRLAHIPGFNIDRVAAAAGTDPEILRMENLDTDIPPPSSNTSRPSGISVGAPVGPITTTGGPATMAGAGYGPATGPGPPGPTGPPRPRLRAMA